MKYQGRGSKAQTKRLLALGLRSGMQPRTPKQRVLARYPGAVASLDKYGRYEITHLKTIGSGNKERDAWIDAAKKL